MRKILNPLSTIKYNITTPTKHVTHRSLMSGPTIYHFIGSTLVAEFTHAIHNDVDMLRAISKATTSPVDNLIDLEEVPHERYFLDVEALTDFANTITKVPECVVEANTPRIKALKLLSLDAMHRKVTNSFSLAKYYNISPTSVISYIQVALLVNPTLIQHVYIDVTLDVTPRRVYFIDVHMYRAIKEHLHYNGMNPFKNTERMFNSMESKLRGTAR